MLYVFIGPRDPRLRAAVAVALGRPGSNDMAYVHLDGARAGLDDLIEACGTISMFGERRKVLLDNAQLMASRYGARSAGSRVRKRSRKSAADPPHPAGETSAGKGRSAAKNRFLTWLADFARGSDHCDLAVAAYLDLSDNRSRGSARTFRDLKQAGAQVESFEPLRGSALRRFVQDRARNQGVSISADALHRLVELVTADAGLLASEVDKLAAYVGFEGTIELDAVDAAGATIGEHARWDYINAVTDRRPDRALAILHDMLALKTPLQMILADLVRSLRDIQTAKSALAAEPGLESIARAFGIRKDNEGRWQRRARMLADRASRVPDKLLLRMYAEVVRTDLALKSTGGDEDALLEILTARLAARPTARRSA